jgi:branched-chain amino acid transport system substrate-binding protein
MWDAGKSQGVDFVGEAATPFGATDFAPGFIEARAKNPTAIILNLYGWDLVHALKAYRKLELAKDKIGVGGMISGEQIGRPLGYADNAGIWGLIWDHKINTDSSRRFIQGVIDKYNHTPTSRCYLGYAAMTQILEAMQRAGTTDTAALIQALEGHEFDGLKEGRSYFCLQDHQQVQDVLVRSEELRQSYLPVTISFRFFPSSFIWPAFFIVSCVFKSFTFCFASPPSFLMLST